MFSRSVSLVVIHVAASSVHAGVSRHDWRCQESCRHGEGVGADVQQCLRTCVARKAAAAQHGERDPKDAARRPDKHLPLPETGSQSMKSAYSRLFTENIKVCDRASDLKASPSFGAMDENGDGQVSAFEAVMYGNKMCVPDEMTRQIFAAADVAPHDGMVTQAEFDTSSADTAVEKAIDKRPASTADGDKASKPNFDEWDHDGDGYLSKSEAFKAFLHEVQSNVAGRGAAASDAGVQKAQGKMWRNMFDKLYPAMDPNGDGRVSTDEFYGYAAVGSFGGKLRDSKDVADPNIRRLSVPTSEVSTKIARSGHRLNATAVLPPARSKESTDDATGVDDVDDEWVDGADKIAQRPVDGHQFAAMPSFSPATYLSKAPIKKAATPSPSHGGDNRLMDDAVEFDANDEQSMDGATGLDAEDEGAMNDVAGVDAGDEQVMDEAAWPDADHERLVDDTTSVDAEDEGPMEGDHDDKNNANQPATTPFRHLETRAAHLLDAENELSADDTGGDNAQGEGLIADAEVDVEDLHSRKQPFTTSQPSIAALPSEAPASMLRSGRHWKTAEAVPLDTKGERLLDDATEVDTEDEGDMGGADEDAEDPDDRDQILTTPRFSEGEHFVDDLPEADSDDEGWMAGGEEDAEDPDDGHSSVTAPLPPAAAVSRKSRASRFLSGHRSKMAEAVRLGAKNRRFIDDDAGVDAGSEESVNGLDDDEQNQDDGRQLVTTPQPAVAVLSTAVPASVLHSGHRPELAAMAPLDAGSEPVRDDGSGLDAQDDNFSESLEGGEDLDDSHQPVSMRQPSAIGFPSAAPATRFRSARRSEVAAVTRFDVEPEPLMDNGPDDQGEDFSESLSERREDQDDSRQPDSLRRPSAAGFPHAAPVKILQSSRRPHVVAAARLDFEPEPSMDVGSGLDAHEESLSETLGEGGEDPDKSHHPISTHQPRAASLPSAARATILRFGRHQPVSLPAPTVAASPSEAPTSTLHTSRRWDVTTPARLDADHDRLMDDATQLDAQDERWMDDAAAVGAEDDGGIEDATQADAESEGLTNDGTGLDAGGEQLMNDATEFDTEQPGLVEDADDETEDPDDELQPDVPSQSSVAALPRTTEALPFHSGPCLPATAVSRRYFEGEGLMEDLAGPDARAKGC